MLTDKVSELEGFRIQLQSATQILFDSCQGLIFPADALFLASNDRALQVLDGFVVLMNADNYSCGMALLRLQLDTVLRLFGVLQTNDVHDTANKVIQGEHLSKIKDKYGKHLKDYHLVEIVSVQNPWVKKVYSLASSYIHLSNSSFFHFIEKAEGLPDSKEKLFYIGSTSENVNEQHKIELVQAFQSLSKAVHTLTLEWAQKRLAYGNLDNLKKRYTHPV